MTWNFNRPVSYRGRLWEKVVQIVKKVMFNMIKNALLTKYLVMIIFTEVKPIINNRPFTYISDGPTNPDAITNYFLSGRFDFSMTVKEDQEYIKSKKEVENLCYFKTVLVKEDIRIPSNNHKVN